MWVRRRVVAAAGCVAALLPLSGCGGGPVPAPGRAGPPPAAAPASGPAPSGPTTGGPAESGPAAASGPVADGQGRTAPDGAVRHVGALFHAGSDHFCSGAVVVGAGADLVVTAAHCVAAAGAAPYDDLEFAPAYGHGTAPYGRWKAARITVDPRWTAGADPDLDVAFVELAPRAGRRVSDLVGADRIGFGPAAGGTVRLTGYPDGADDAITCLGTPTRPSAGQLRVACTGYTAGTSGSPWQAGADPGSATIVGVIGGYQQGGDTADVSYSSYFGADVRQLYQLAVAAH
jgi:V8-like Glu-specific endopeptidase